MNDAFVREISLIGEENFQKLQKAHVAVFGIGGVGSYAAEALVRAGIGALTFVDGDAVAPSNLNRQIVALHSTLGRNKAEVMKERALDIAPECRVRAVAGFFGADRADEFDFSAYDYVADCIDSVKSKVLLICRARQAGVPVISCMGAGNKLDAGAFRVADIEKTREFLVKNWSNTLESNGGVLGVINYWYQDGLDYMNNYLNTVKSVTNEDVQKLAQKILADGNMVYVVMRPEAEAPADQKAEAPAAE